MFSHQPHSQVTLVSTCLRHFLRTGNAQHRFTRHARVSLSTTLLPSPLCSDSHSQEPLGSGGAPAHKYCQCQDMVLATEADNSHHGILKVLPENAPGQLVVLKPGLVCVPGLKRSVLFRQPGALRLG